MLPRCTKIPKLSLTSHEKSISLLTLVNNFHHKKTSICRLNISRVETLAALFHSCPPHRTLSPYIHIYRARLANFRLHGVHAFSLWCTIVCHSDSASVLSYSFLTVDYCSLCCARLVSQLRFVSVRGTNTLYNEPLFTLPILQAFTAAQDMLIPQVPLVSLGSV